MKAGYRVEQGAPGDAYITSLHAEYMMITLPVNRIAKTVPTASYTSQELGLEIMLPIVGPRCTRALCQTHGDSTLLPSHGHSKEQTTPGRMLPLCPAFPVSFFFGTCMRTVSGKQPRFISTAFYSIPESSGTRPNVEGSNKECRRSFD